MLQGTRMQRFSQDGLRDTQRGDRSFTFLPQLHIPRDPSCFCLFVAGTSPPPPATSTQHEQGSDTHIIVWVSERMSWSVWALFGVRMWQL